jgi:hypothetical protein
MSLAAHDKTDRAAGRRRLLLVILTAVVAVLVLVGLGLHDQYLAAQNAAPQSTAHFVLSLDDHGLLGAPRTLTVKVGQPVEVVVQGKVSSEKVVSIENVGTRAELEETAGQLGPGDPIQFTPDHRGSFAIREEMEGKRLGTVIVR